MAKKNENDPLNEPEVDIFLGGEREEEEEIEGDRGDALAGEEPETPEGQDEDDGEESEEQDDGEEPEEQDDGEEPEADAAESDDADEQGDGDEGEEEDDGNRPTQNQRIPKQRFDQVNERRKSAEAERDALRERLERLEVQMNGRAEEDGSEQPDAPQFDFKAKELEYMELVADGEFEKAYELREEIRSAEREQVRSEMAQLPQQAAQLTREQQSYLTEVARLEQSYAEFDSESTETYREDLVNDVLALKDALVESRGWGNARALREAASRVARMEGLAARGEEGDGEEVETPAPKAEPKQRPADVKAKAKAAKQQPPKMETGSVSTEKPVDVTSMSDEEFDALPEATKAKLRGDLV